MKVVAVLVLIYSSLALLFGYSCGQSCTNLPLPDLEVDYIPKGMVVNEAGMDTYETGNPNATRAIIAVYDIYGFTPSTNNIYQICDYLGDLGYRVIMPDFFHGEPWKREHYPAPTDQEYYDFVKATSWDESVKEDLGLVLSAYKAKNVTEFGLFGFCFGGKIAAHSVAEYFQDIHVAAQFHPAGANISDAALIRRPTLLLPGANDPDMTEYCEIINQTLLGPESCVYHHMRDVNHGYSGGQANWGNTTIRIRAQDALQMFHEFLWKKFPAM